MRNGRPTKLTPQLQADFIKALRRSLYIETAAAMVDVPRMTIYRWIKRGSRCKSGIYYEFCYAVKKAIAEKEADDVDLIGKAAKKIWQAAAWRLERRHPERWGGFKQELADMQKRMKAIEKADAARGANA